MASVRDELTCQELVELVTDYLEGALAPAERERFEAHLTVCEGCEGYLVQMLDTVAALGAVADLEARPEVAVLLETYRDWKSGV